MRLLILIAFLLIGCSPKPTLEVPTTTIEPGIYTPAGEPVSEAEMLERLADARVVLVAESHDSADDHAVQLRVLRELAGRKPVGLGMEMFQRPFQPTLDLFVAGEIEEEDMLEQTEWEDRWGFETELYRPLWSFARDRGFAVVALNVRRELTKRIAKAGLDGLTDAERDSLPQLDLTDDRYRAWLGEVFASHGAEMESEKLDQFFAAQIAWDETMADTAAKWAKSHPGATLVVAAGRGHIERDWGIPSRLRRRLGAQYGDGTVISVVPVSSTETPRWSWAKRERFADYVWVRKR